MTPDQSPETETSFVERLNAAISWRNVVRVGFVLALALAPTKQRGPRAHEKLTYNSGHYIKELAAETALRQERTSISERNMVTTVEGRFQALAQKVTSKIGRQHRVVAQHAETLMWPFILILSNRDNLDRFGNFPVDEPGTMGGFSYYVAEDEARPTVITVPIGDRRGDSCSELLTHRGRTAGWNLSTPQRDCDVYWHPCHPRLSAMDNFSTTIDHVDSHPTSFFPDRIYVHENFGRHGIADDISLYHRFLKERLAALASSEMRSDVGTNYEGRPIDATAYAYTIELLNMLLDNKLLELASHDVAAPSEAFLADVYARLEIQNDMVAQDYIKVLINMAINYYKSTRSSPGHRQAAQGPWELASPSFITFVRGMRNNCDVTDENSSGDRHEHIQRPITPVNLNIFKSRAKEREQENHEREEPEPHSSNLSL